MPGPLLLTKFYVPHLRAEHVWRPRLTRRLDDVLTRGITLVCAPAGYGKTMLIAEWLTGRKIAIATGAADAAGLTGPACGLAVPRRCRQRSGSLPHLPCRGSAAD